MEFKSKESRHITFKAARVFSFFSETRQESDILERFSFQIYAIFINMGKKCALFVGARPCAFLCKGEAKAQIFPHETQKKPSQL